MDKTVVDLKLYKYDYTENNWDYMCEQCHAPLGCDEINLSVYAHDITYKEFGQWHDVVETE